MKAVSAKADRMEIVMAEMTVEKLVEEIRKKAAAKDLSGYQGFLAVQVDIKKPDGVFYVEVKEGKASVEPYEYHDRNARLIITMENFLKLMNGKLDPVFAYTTGKLKVEGDAGKVLELTKLI